MLRTPVTFESLIYLRTKIEQGTAFDSPGRYRFQKLANAAEKAFADCAIFFDENKLLFKQNNEKTTRLSIKLTVIKNAKVVTYNDIVKAQKKYDIKKVIAPDTK